MSPKPDVSEERKNQILDAAMSIFARVGFHTARMDDVAEEAGLSKGALYWYFKSKDAIINAILERLFHLALKDLLKLQANEEGSVREGLIAYTRQAVGYMDRLKMLMPMMYEFYALAARQKRMQVFIKEYYGQYVETMAKLIQRGIDRGEFKATDPQEAAITLIAIYEGLVLLWVFIPQVIQLEQQAQASVKLFLEGLLSQ